MLSLSPSKMHTYDTCPHQFELKYVQRLKSKTTSSNLVFGHALHASIEQIVKAHEDFSPLSDEACADAFEVAFEEEASKVETLELPKKSTKAELVDMGKSLAIEFNEVWPSFELTPLTKEDGSLLQEVRLEKAISPTLKLVGIIDLIAMDKDGNTVVIDFKTARTPADEDFVMLSEQLTAYQILVDHHAKALGLDKTAKVGFLEIKKNKTKASPRVLAPVLAERRVDAQVQALTQKMVWMQYDVDQGRFSKRPMMAFNSPCKMCDYCQFCTKGDPQGLIAA